MNRKNIPLLLMLTAGAMTCIITFVRKYELVARLTALLIVLLVFYVIGSIIQWTLDRFDAQNQKAKEEEEAQAAAEAEGAEPQEGQDTEEDQEI